MVLRVNILQLIGYTMNLFQKYNDLHEKNKGRVKKDKGADPDKGQNGRLINS